MATAKAQSRRISVALDAGANFISPSAQFQGSGKGGMFSAGDGGSQPQGYARLLSNILSLPNRLSVRPPFVYDSVMNVNGLANFDDPTNKVSRAVCIDTAGHLRLKSATLASETWGSPTSGTISGTRITDFCNYRGTMYAMVDNGAGLPSAAFSDDGTTLNTSPFNSAIQGRTVTTFNDRLFIAYPRVTVINNTSAYTAGWVATNGSIRTIAANGTTTYRFFPTSTTAASFGSSGSISTGSFPTGQPLVFRQDFRNQSATYAMPVTLEIVLVNAWIPLRAYAVGDLISDGTNRQRVITAGTSAAGAPAWGATVGATVADGTVTWICEGSQVVISLESTLPVNNGSGNWTTITLAGLLPAAGNALTFYPNIKFFNSTVPTITLAAVDVAYKDGLADGDARKKNYGSQLTQGDFYYPFLNVESGSTATIDLPSVVWSEIADPKRIRNANFQALIEAAGDPTAATTASGRYVVFKRNALWSFQGTSDPDIPIRRELFDSEVGCLGPQALDVYENEIFFIGDNELYRFRPGDAAPTPFAGEGMREEILSRGSNWVESQSTYKRPILKIDKRKLIVWVYTQKSVLYAYDLRNARWTKHTCPNSSEVDAMLWNSNTGNFYVALSSATYGLTRLDYTLTQNDTIDNTVNTYSVSADVVFRTIELYDPPRYDATIEEVRFFHASTADQTSQTVSANYSFDQATTYTKSETVTLSPLSLGGEFLPVRLDCWYNAPSITVKLNHTGKAGAAAWTISPRAYAMLNIRRGEYIQNNATAVSSTL